MGRYRNSFSQFSDRFFLTDAGLETDLIFNRGIEIREFAAHTLLPDPRGREALADYFRGFLTLAREHDAGFILDTQTWKAHAHWAEALGTGDPELREANEDAVAFISGLRDGFSTQAQPILLSGTVGPKGDAYAVEWGLAMSEAEAYHSKQIEWLANTDIDMVTALTIGRSSEAIGIVRAATSAGLPVVISFTVETDGRLPDGQELEEAITAVDESTDGAAAYFMLNCAHPDHFMDVLDGSEWTRRIRGLRCNASRRSHEELDNSDELDDGDPVSLADSYRLLFERMPWLNVFGGCCGSDLRHVTEIAKVVLRQVA